MYLALGQLPLIYCILGTLKKRNEDALVRSFKKIKTDDEFEVLVYRIWRLINNVHQRRSRILLDGFIQLHRLKFSALSDHLRYRDLKERGDMQGENVESKRINPDSTTLEEDSSLNDQYNGLLYHLITKGVQQFPKSHRLRLLLANFQYHKMGVFWSPIAQLRSIFEQKPSTSNWSSAVQLQLAIEKELNLRDHIDKASTTMNIKHILEYDKVYYKFLERVTFAAGKNLDFWTELSTKDPDSNKLLDLGSSLLVINKRVKKSFLKLIEYGVALSNIYQIFAGFVRLVTHDQDLNLDILEKANQLRKKNNENQLNSTQKLNFGLDEEVKKNEEKLTVMQVSGNREDMGTILSVSNSIWSLLGYKPTELEGSSLNCLLPRYFYEKHDHFIEKFLQTEIQEVMNSTRLVFAMTRNGFIKACSLHLKIISSVSKGITLVGALSEAKKRLVSRD